MLTLNWKRFLKNTVFLCPNGMKTVRLICRVSGFDLSKDDEEYILKKSLEAESVIKNFIEEVKSKYKLTNANIVLCGFSQGCMMSINADVTSEQNFNCVVGFSGRLLIKIIWKKNKK